MNDNHQVNDDDDSPNPKRAIGTGTLILGALVLLFRLARCAMHSQTPAPAPPIPSPIRPEQVSQLADVDLKVSFASTEVPVPDSAQRLLNLTVKYQITNRRKTPILLLNRLPRAYHSHDYFPRSQLSYRDDLVGKYTHDDRSAIVLLPGSGLPKLYVAQGAYTMRSLVETSLSGKPVGYNTVLRTVVPGVTRLAPGKTYTEEVKAGSTGDFMSGLTYATFCLQVVLPEQASGETYTEKPADKQHPDFLSAPLASNEYEYEVDNTLPGTHLLCSPSKSVIPSNLGESSPDSLVPSSPPSP
jgi:hypothetical protein